MSKPKQPIERGTQNTSDVDMEWLPKEVINELSEYMLKYFFLIFIFKNCF